MSEHKTSIVQISNLDWKKINATLNDEGLVVIEEVLTASQCKELIGLYEQPIYRKTVNMERFRFGKGEYKYFNYPLPPLIATLRAQIYTLIVDTANGWMQSLKTGISYPAKHEEFIARCHSQNQLMPTPLILKYGEGGYNTLHQDLYGPVYFPFQALLILNEPKTDYTGGEFVITEQVPRAQSKARVLSPGKGDLVIFTTNFRPVRGSKGYYRANMKHGVSPVLSGERHTLGVIFHDGSS